MTHTHVKFELLAQRLIDAKGTSANIVRLLPGDDDTQTPGGEVGYACRCVITNFSEVERANSQVEVGDVRMIVSTKGLNVIPDVADRLQVGSVSHEIVDVSRVAPAGTALLWKVHARGSQPDATVYPDGAPELDEATW